MRKPLAIFSLLVFALSAGGAASGQTTNTTATTSTATPATTQSRATTTASASAIPEITANYAMGEVTSIDAGGQWLMVKNKSGEVSVLLTAETKYFSLPPGETTMSKAQTIALSGVGVGDRVMARGRVAADQKSVPARQVIVMSKAAIAEKNEREREEWRRRGIVGRVTNINTASKEITVLARGREGERPVIISVPETAKFRRYAPDSVRFSDARQSSLAEIRVGDQLRALGEKSADGAHFTPEEIVSGSFRMVGGPVASVNVAAGEIKITNLDNKQPLTVVVNSNSILRRFPPELVAMIARAQGAGNSGGGRAAGAAQQQSNAQAAPPPGSGGGMRMMAGGGDLDERIERLPQITIADLKPGDVIAVSSTTGTDPARVTAIKLVTGVEALVNRQTAQQRNQSNQSSPSLSVPGLDGGIGLP